jgi:hypothetical protein
MKIVVIGGTGLIGSSSSPFFATGPGSTGGVTGLSGVNTLTGEGLATALTGAQIVVDVANSPSFEGAAVMNFFKTTGRNLSRLKQRRLYDIVASRRRHGPVYRKADTFARSWRRKS